MGKGACAICFLAMLHNQVTYAKRGPCKVGNTHTHTHTAEPEPAGRAVLGRQLLHRRSPSGDDAIPAASECRVLCMMSCAS